MQPNLITANPHIVFPYSHILPDTLRQYSLVNSRFDAKIQSIQLGMHVYRRTFMNNAPLLY